MIGRARGFATLPVLALGFRAFFLLAGVFAVAAMLLWGVVLTGRGPALGPLWHGHEMLFGYTGAVIAGFILTAASNWTGRPTLVRAPLAALALVWVAARVVAALPAAPDGLKAALCAGFFVYLAVGVGRPIVAAGSRRNYGVMAVLGVFAALELLYWLAPGMRVPVLNAAVLFVMVLIALIGGRVVPIFTRNAVAGVCVRKTGLWRDHASLASLVVLAVLALIPATPPRLFAAVAALGALAHGLRMLGWGSSKTLRHPILWVLHAAYVCLPVGLALWAAPGFGVPIARTVALHVLAVGTLGLMTLGMMTRVALGHTGRPLAVGKTTTLAYALLVGAVIVRGGGPFFGVLGWTNVMLTAAGLWTAAFVIFVIAYTPVLVAPRIDGKSG